MLRAIGFGIRMLAVAQAPRHRSANSREGRRGPGRATTQKGAGTRYREVDRRFGPSVTRGNTIPRREATVGRVAPS